MVKNIVLLFTIFLSCFVNSHNIINFGVPNLILPEQNLHQTIPAVIQWTPSKVPTKLSSYGARYDQFVRYLNTPVFDTTTLGAYNIPVQGFARPPGVSLPTGAQFLVPFNDPPVVNGPKLYPFGPQQTIQNTIQQSTASVPFQSPLQTSANIPFSLNIPSINPLEFSAPTKPITTNPSSTNTEMNVLLNDTASNIPFSLNIPSENPLDSTYITQFAKSIKPTSPNPINTNTGTKILFNSPVDSEKFGQPLRPVFIETEKITNNNDPNFPIDTIIPNIPFTPNQLNPGTVPNLYNDPTRGFSSVSNKQLYSSPVVSPSEQLPKTIEQSSQPSIRQLYILKKFPVLPPNN